MKQCSLTNFAKVFGQIFLVAAVSLLALISSPATPQTVVKVAGELWVNGSVEVNGRAAATGMTVFSGGRIRVGPGGAATVQLGKKTGSIKLMADSDLVLSLLSGVIGGQLANGRITVVTPKGVSISVPTAMGEVVSREPLDSIFTIEATADRTKICVERGKGALKLASPVPEGKPSLKAGGTVENVDEGEALTATTSGQAVRHRCAAALAGKASGGLHIPVAPVVVGAVAGAVPLIVYGASPGLAAGTGRPTRTSP